MSLRQAFAKACLRDIKQCAKTAHARDNTRTHGFCSHWADASDKLVARIDIDAGIFITQSGIRLLFAFVGNGLSPLC